MTHSGVEHLDSADEMTQGWWLRAIQGSRSEDAKDDPISVSTRGTDGYVDPDEIGSFETEGGVARHVESGHALSQHRAMEDAGLDPTEHKGFIDTTGSGVDDRIEMADGTFEGTEEQFLDGATSLDADTSQDLGIAAWEDKLDPSGRGNGETGSTNPDPSENLDPYQGDVPAPGDDGPVGPAPGDGGGARPRRPDGQSGSSIFGGGSSQAGGVLGTGVSGRQAAVGTAAVGGIGLLAYLFLL